MINLEEEYEKLRQSCVKQIADKLTAGELTAREAEDLTELVYSRMPHRDTSYLDDDGWSSSQRCW